MQGQGCGQTSTHGPEWGEDFLPMLQALHRLLSPPFLGAGRSPSTVLMLLAGKHPREVLGCRTSHSGPVPVEEMDFVQT